MFASKGFNIFVALFFLLTGVLNLVGSLNELSLYQLAIGIVFSAIGVFWFKHNVK